MKNIWIFLPLGIFLALVNYHYYDFYQNNFVAGWNYLGIKPDLSRDWYDEIQKYHPYYDLYLQAKIYRQKPVYYLFTRAEPQDKLFLDELYLRVVNFFYPRKIEPVYRLSRFLALNLPPGALVISDYKLEETSLNNRLLRLNTLDSLSRPQDYFYKQELPYYLYKTR